MPPRRKAAAAAASSSKKGKKDVKQEEADVQDAQEGGAPAPDVKEEEAEPAPTAKKAKAAPATRASGRATRKGAKKEEDEPAEEQPAAETAVEPALAPTEAADVTVKSEDKPAAKGKAKAKGKGKPAVAATQAVENDAAASIAPDVQEPPFDASLRPASDAATPDVMGVVEMHEDEDVIMDDAEPAPMDAEEARRLQERPEAAIDTSSQPPALHPGSQKLAAQMLDEASNAREQVIAEASTSSAALAEEKANSADEQPGTSNSREDRMARMNALRRRMNESATANRKDVVAAQNEHKKAMSESKRLERKRKQAEAMGEKLDALETGEDLERKRNWEYSLADNERWNKKQARKDRRADQGFVTYDESARRQYRSHIDALKPDHKAYLAQKAAAMGMSVEEAEAAVAAGASTELIASTSGGGQLLAGSDNFYRDSNSFAYADHKPTDDAIDRVVSQINLDIDKRGKRSRARNEDEGDITYINDRNKVFNKKLERYFNKYTEEIKSNFERGTAL